ncbi:4-(cytidine 5'-diphospho)-2-C-methyl-D-erythritol kinase [Nakamurella antarctica]|uniref:4-diphosphocytidyl-2-C-methyl-D-erythritol kinase n=1 Tax=Nakamurella antarctica TaxID=1902245 RepID=A0A3G8ZKF6_9ACTN|nr:4-(cytidine 5'-diphospho)-2-C-methyl-D-erythritol kinase [Nakamurella antarctica]AZI57335.1 4-(cytidine 5'-diphospho)-2-C-methyl-D-erythritol kinase [Nakamurella antarctica]
MTPGSVRVRVPAKINLHLGVGEVRPDGFHELVTVFHAVDLYDKLTVANGKGLRVRTVGIAGAPADGDNLAGRAALLLAAHAGIPCDVRIEIVKTIPIAGGMAGGSADAAAALLGCAQLWNLELTRAELAGFAAELGSDVPFALTGGTAVGTGRGELIAPVLGKHPLHWVLAISDGGLSTPAVFAELDRLRAAGDVPRVGGVTALLAALVSGDPGLLASHLGNDMQAAAVSLQPHLRRVLFAGTQEGALASIVSGSGPTVAMLCRSAEHAAEVGINIAGLGICKSVRVVSGPAPGARIISDNEKSA